MSQEKLRTVFRTGVHALAASVERKRGHFFLGAGRVLGAERIRGFSYLVSGPHRRLFLHTFFTFLYNISGGLVSHGFHRLQAFAKAKAKYQATGSFQALEAQTAALMKLRLKLCVRKDFQLWSDRNSVCASPTNRVSAYLDGAPGSLVLCWSFVAPAAKRKFGQYY